MRKTKPKTKPKTDPEFKIAEAALHLIARKGWAHVTVESAARTAKIPASDAKKNFADKTDLLPAIVHMIDARMSATVGDIDSNASAHDRLFEILMARIDVLQSHRRAITNIMDAMRRDPRMIRKTLPAQAKAMGKVIKLGGPESKGLREPFVIAGLLGIYSLTLCVWRNDSSSDMSRTMASLDRYLRRACFISDILFRQNRTY